MESDSYSTNLENYFKVYFIMDTNKDKDSKYTQMDPFSQEIIPKIKNMVKVDFNGQMDKFMMDNGLMIKNMEVDNGQQIIQSPMSDNGNQIESKVLVYLSKVNKDMKDSLLIL